MLLTLVELLMAVHIAVLVCWLVCLQSLVPVSGTMVINYPTVGYPDRKKSIQVSALVHTQGTAPYSCLVKRRVHSAIIPWTDQLA